MAACTICQHPQRPAITTSLERGDSLRQIGAVYGVDKSTLARHKNTCLIAVSVARQADTNAISLGQYHGEALQLLAALTDYQHQIDVRQGLAAVVGLLVKMTAEPDTNGTVR